MTISQLMHYLREWPGKHADVVIQTPDGVILDPTYVDMIDGNVTITTERREALPTCDLCRRTQESGSGLTSREGHPCRLERRDRQSHLVRVKTRARLR